ncbi:hypothetical protein FHS95_001291 [Sphingomonas naasensis]|uniref:Uncharacterized protein n=1 Tax=Sphingomonas naasensis TaxID=1344951 RepID=A0A4S1W7Z6_9SPHN|nr:hypothetical protein [Sphingomonas naasensis]NIJ19622.1 hypothetical protein [Sphingomonas naasensis]TGX37300.1 hypothetical protein E5A74_20370 [Sphingomonas naasensis]
MASAARDYGSYLFDAAQRHVAAMGRGFGDGADAALREMTARAGAFFSEEEAQGRPVDIAAAEADLIALLDHAAMLARDIPGYPDGLLGEQSLFPALSWFCPRHPFC